MPFYLVCKDDIHEFCTIFAGFANEAQLLLVNEASLQDLNARLLGDGAAEDAESVAVERFRPNLLIGGETVPFCEDAWDSLAIGKVGFQVAGVTNASNFILC